MASLQRRRTCPLTDVACDDGAAIPMRSPMHSSSVADALFANIGKRQRRSPKIYIRDTGLLYRLLGIDDRLALESEAWR